MQGRSGLSLPEYCYVCSRALRRGAEAGDLVCGVRGFLPSPWRGGHLSTTASSIHWFLVVRLCFELDFGAGLLHSSDCSGVCLAGHGMWFGPCVVALGHSWLTMSNHLSLLPLFLLRAIGR
mmetsp:Transcript_19011/g.28335  ORF Transcript_19011/g.28335 Transcript_19011/m.28335 type:complete len:121 (+) Transcript_19011:348-710(+)